MKNQTILVTGGAGYIGSVTVFKLVLLDYNVIVIDNLKKGKKELVDKKAQFIEGDILDEKLLQKIFSQHKINKVIHFAALKSAGESMQDLASYSQNITGTINIINKMVEHNVKDIIFSSSAAVYGEPQEEIIEETHPTNPVNFYGFTKLEAERIIDWYVKLKDISCVSLRYFNVAGDGGLNYVDPYAENIFPIIGEVLSKKREILEVYGDDYSTRDGSCIRDYIHVEDIASAHIKVLDLKGSHVINLGTSEGISVLELVDVFKEVAKKDVPYKITSRREGDPAMLIASNKKAKELLNWMPQKTIKDMVESTLSVYYKQRL